MAGIMLFQLTVLLLLMSGSTVLSNDTLDAFDCSQPKNSKYISHQECRKSMNILERKKFSIVQTKVASKIKGFICKGFKTAEVSYCGAYRQVL